MGEDSSARPEPLDQIAAALAAFQAEMPVVQKGKTANVRSDKGSYSYTYAGLAEVAEAALPLLSRHGLSFVCLPGNGMLTGVLLHTSGQKLTGSLPVSGSTPQQVGSSLTYMRRYLLGCMTGIVTDDDDDGHAASAPQRKPPRRQQTPAPVEASAPPPGAGPDGMTEAQKKNMRRLFAAHLGDLAKDREVVLATVAEAVGREVESSNDLTKQEGVKLINWLMNQVGEVPGA